MSEQEHTWRVVPLSTGQLQDVRPEDVIDGGLYRRCETYRGGGGYDQFPVRAEQHFGVRHHVQFIVQLRGCNLDCPYCYVTREGVWGTPLTVTTSRMVADFIRAKENLDTTVFHLMGGAPALQLKFWPELLRALSDNAGQYVFHSDLMLSESEYDVAVLDELTRHPVLCAVDVKGLDAAEHVTNTRKELDEARMWRNVHRLETSKLRFYYTFTNVSERNVQEFFAKLADRYGKDQAVRRRAESFSIDLIDYAATPYVDRIAWGGAV